MHTPPPQVLITRFFRIVAAGLIGFSITPTAIVFYQFICVGGLDWPMHWQNEATAWQAMLTAFAVAAFFISRRVRNLSPIYFTCTGGVAFLICAFSLLSLTSGVSPSSKSDASSLRLAEFWHSGWWQ